MGQMGFYDLANRYAGLDAKNEPLVKIDEPSWPPGSAPLRRPPSLAEKPPMH